MVIELAMADYAEPNQHRSELIIHNLVDNMLATIFGPLYQALHLYGKPKRREFASSVYLLYGPEETERGIR